MGEAIQHAIDSKSSRASESAILLQGTSEEHDLEVAVVSHVGEPATSDDLVRLQSFAGDEAEALAALYERYNGIAFHVNGETAGLVVAPVEALPELNADWRAGFAHLEPQELYDFQRDGFAFATIAASGNYFVIHGGKIYYSDHDGGDDTIWGSNLEEFFSRALSDPSSFLYHVGCYTRYSDGETDRQFIPETFVHD